MEENLAARVALEGSDTVRGGVRWREMAGSLPRRLLVALGLLAALTVPLGVGTRAKTTHPADRLQRIFAAVAREFGVPEAVLVAVSYHESLWDDHGRSPSTSGGYGPMHLVQVDRVPAAEARGLGKPAWRDVRHDPALHTLDAAARLLGRPAWQLEADEVQNIRGGAALLTQYARRTLGGRIPTRIGGWYGAVADYSGSRDAAIAGAFANAVYASIRHGEARWTINGEWVRLAPQVVTPDRRTVRALELQPAATTKAECPKVLACRYVPAAHQVNNPSDPTDFGNYDVANRPKDGLVIRYIVIHDTEGSYSSAIATFQSPTRYASANYVIRSSDGQVTQMVPNEDIAWHAGNYFVNMHAIGIEHEGMAVQGASWYSEQMYEASARLVKYLARRYQIPVDRAHIVGHDGVPGPTPATQRSQHWDPGPYWDWQHFMDLVGAPPPVSDAGSKIVQIAPDFATNQPTITDCSGGSCRVLPAQPSNFLYLRSAPAANAPLIGDPALNGPGQAGSAQAADWGDKVLTGEQFVRVGRRGDWDAIDDAGRKAWLYDPASAPVTVPVAGQIVTPRAGLASIPVYGSATPESSVYPSYVPSTDRPRPVPLQYRIPAGQKYVASGLVTADFYWAPTPTRHTLVTSRTKYYQIFLNHRFAFVRASDVRMIQVAPPLPTPTPTPSPTPGETVIVVATPTPATP